MNTQKTTQNMKNTVYSGSLALTLASIIAAAMFALPTVAWSQTDEWTVYNTVNSGLPSNNVWSLAFDAQGNLWIGTCGIGGGGQGLAKFDGENWTVYTTANSGLPCNNVYDLAFDAHENLWIATGEPFGEAGGLAKFDGESWTVYNAENSGLPSKDVWALAFDAQGSLWIGTYGGGLAKFDGENWTVYNRLNSGLPYNNVFCYGLAFDGQGNLWVGTVDPICGQEGGGLAKFDGENWTVYNKANSGLTSNDVWALAFDAQGYLWIGTGDDYHPGGGGLVKFDGENWTVYHTSNSPLTWHMVLSLVFDGQENLWMGMASSHTTTGGVARFDGETWTVYNKSNSGLPSVIAFGLAFDAQGNVWIGAHGAGLAVYRPVPAVDFNADEIVNFKDFSMLAQYWHQDKSPFGDRRVDYEYLAVLADYWLKEVLPFSLIAYWKLDETEGILTHDSAGDHDGILMTENALWRPLDGMVNGALELDGIYDYVSTPFVLDPDDGPFSVFAWVRGGAAGQVILSQAGRTNWLLTDSATGALMTELKPGLFGKPLSSQAVITDGDWCRVGLTWDGSNRILYVNDVEVAKDTQTGVAASDNGLNIGAGKNLSAGSFFSGLIDDVRIYNKALSSKEIEELSQ